jgi:hypothetical protein
MRSLSKQSNFDIDPTTAAVSRVANMAISSDQATHLDVAALSDIETTAANTESPEKELLSQDRTSEVDPLPVMSEDLACEPEKSGEVQELDRIQEPADVEETALGSPFPPPKLVADDHESVVSLEEGEIMEEMRSKSAVASSVLVQGQEEQSNEQAELKLGRSPLHYARHQLTCRGVSQVVKKESLVASTSDVQAETAEVDIETENADFKTDTDTTIEAPKPSKPAHSLPPHMRPDLQSLPSRHFGVQGSMVGCCIDL